MPEGYKAGAVYTELSFVTDERKLREYERQVDKAEQKSKRDKIETQLGAKLDERAFHEYERQLGKASEKAKRRDAFKASLGGDFDPAAFRAYEKALEQASREQDKVARSAREMDTQLAKTEKAHARHGSTLGAVYGKAGRTGSAIAGLYGLQSALRATLGVSATFDEKLSQIGQTTGASAKQLDAMRNAAIEMGASTGKGARQAADGILELSKGGLDAKQIIGGGLKGSLALATAGGLDMADASTAVANALNLFGLRGDKATHIADAFATAANATTADVGDFAMALSQGGGAAKAAGLSFDETTAALEALALAGVKNSDAGTSLKAALSHIVNPSTAAANAMKSLKLEFFDAEGNMKPLVQVAADLRDKMGGLTREQRLQKLQTIAGTDGFRALLALYDQGPKSLARLEKGLGKQGTAADAATAKQHNLAGAWRAVKASAESYVLSLTGAGGKGGATSALTEAGEKASHFIDEMRTGKGEGGKFADTMGDVAHGAKDVATFLGRIVGWAVKFGEQHPGLSKVAGEFAAIALSVKAISAVSRWSGITGLIGLMGKLRGAAAGAAEAEAVAAGGGAAGGAVAGRFAKARGALNPLAAGAAATFLGSAYFDDQAKQKSAAGLPTTGGFVGQGVRKVRAVGDLLGSGKPGQVLKGLFGTPQDPEKDLRKFGDEADKQFARARKAADGVKLARLAQEARDLAQRFPSAAAGLNRFADAAEKSARVAKITGDALRRNLHLGARDIMDPGAVEQFLSNIGRMRTSGIRSITDLRQNMEFNAKQIRKGLADGSKGAADAMAENFGSGIRAVKRAMKDGTVSTTDGMKEIRRITRQQMGFARDHMSELSADGKQKLAANFASARNAVEARMKETGQKTDAGMKVVRDLMAAELKLYGLSSAQIKRQIAGKDAVTGKSLPGGTTHTNAARGGRIRRAVGGWLGARGMVSDDVVPIGDNAIAAFGEFDANGPGGQRAILNRHQAPYVERALAAGGLPGLDHLPSGNQLPVIERAMSPFGGLDSLFSSVTRPHYLASGGHVRKVDGGMGAFGTPGQIGQAAVDKIRDAANRQLEKYATAKAAEDAAAAPTTGGGGGGGKTASGPDGVGAFEGIPMANWVIGALRYARAKGFSANPTSGYRTHAHNVAMGRNYFSEHEGTQYPHGAVDFGGFYDHISTKMAFVDAVKDYRYPMLAPIGFRDDGHASGTGHARGGRLGRLARRFGAGGVLASQGGAAWEPSGTGSGMIASQGGSAWEDPRIRVGAMTGTGSPLGRATAPRIYVTTAADRELLGVARADMSDRDLAALGLDARFFAGLRQDAADAAKTGTATTTTTAAAAAKSKRGRFVTVRGGAHPPHANPNLPRQYPLSKRGRMMGGPGVGTHSRSEGPNNWESDEAVDLGVPVGTPVLAMMDGLVSRIGGFYKNGAGRMEGLTAHLRWGGDEAFYQHMSGRSVKAGQRIKQGEVIGRSGKGNGVAHLHLGIEHANPLRFIDGGGRWPGGKSRRVWVPYPKPKAATGPDLPGAQKVGGHAIPSSLAPFNRRYAKHYLRNSGGFPALAPGIVGKIAAWAGLPSRQFEQIAHGESTYHPGIIGLDPRGTKGYGLWQNTTSVNGAGFESGVRRLGGWDEMLNPFKNALMAKTLYDNGGLSHWFGTKYLTKARAAGGRLFAGGGRVRGKARPAKTGGVGMIAAQGGEAFAPRAGMKSKGSSSVKGIKSLDRMQNDRFNDYQDAVDEAGGLETSYAHLERELGRDDVDPLNTDGTLNADALANRVADLQKLVDVRKRLEAAYEKAERIARRIAESYRTIVRRLRAQLNAAKGKDRTGVDDQIKRYVALIPEWEKNAKDAHESAWSSAQDVEDLLKEQGAVRGTKAQTATDAGLADSSLAQTDDSFEVRPPSAEEIAQAASDQFAAFKSQTSDMFASFGQNFVRGGTSPFDSEAGRAAGMRQFGAATATGGGVLAGAGADQRPNVTFDVKVVDPTHNAFALVNAMLGEAAPAVGASPVVNGIRTT